MNIQNMIDVFKIHGNHRLVEELDIIFHNDSDLIKWRKYFENIGGFAQDSWFAYWSIIIRDMDIKNFLDIGVLGGQFSILVKLLAKRYNKNIEVYSVSPFDGLGDLYSTYAQIDYLKIFQKSCIDLNINFDDFHIYKGLSQDKNIQNNLKNIKFQLQYIDGDHTYNGVRQDIEFYTLQLLDSNGLVVFDDSESYLPSNCCNHLSFWQGHQQVIEAVCDSMDNRNNFVELFRITHNRIFKRV